MLWDLVYEFYIKHIFGGFIMENGNASEYKAFFGYGFASGNNRNIDTSRVTAIVLKDVFGQEFTLSYGNYFSLIATIITMVIIVTLCALFIVKIVKLIGGLIR